MEVVMSRFTSNFYRIYQEVSPHEGYIALDNGEGWTAYSVLNAGGELRPVCSAFTVDQLAFELSKLDADESSLHSIKYKVAECKVLLPLNR
jgi:hypothetical protein